MDLNKSEMELDDSKIVDLIMDGVTNDHIQPSDKKRISDGKD